MKKLLPLLLCGVLLCACSDPAGPTQAHLQTEPEPTALSTNITTYNPDGSVQRMEQVYNTDGVLVQANHYSGSNLMVSYAVTCNEQGQPLKMEDESFGTGVSMVYTYDAQGKTLKIETWLKDSVFLIQSYTYGEDGAKTTYTEEDLRTGTCSQTRYGYENGLQTLEEFYENDALLYTWKYTYDSENRRSSGLLLDQNGVEDGSRQYAYTPESTTVTTLDIQGQAVSTKQSFYDSLGQLVKEVLTVGEKVTTTEYTHLPQKEEE